MQALTGNQAAAAAVRAARKAPVWASGGVWLALLLLALVLGGCATRGGGTGTSSMPALRLDPAGREAVVAQAMMLVNTPYTYGGNTPRGGFDCSGLVQYAVASGAAGGQSLPRSTAQWAAVSTPVQSGRMQRGDLVFFNTSGRTYSHMGIYVGGGQFVHAPSSGGTVRKDSMNSPYYAQRFVGARTVFKK
ncbi:MAG: C40 family peptidase [Burkholderiaceae bacterium]|jgi:cell wall-associated NlpC family hydrolase|nr:C40 family peptidase [Burkholderiaceae bacterium]